MSCLWSCLFYAFFFIVLFILLVNIYVKLYTGRHYIDKSLKGKVALITGGTAGIGKETVRELAKHEATIHVLARDIPKAERVLGEIKESTGNDNIHIHHADLADFSTVRSFVKKFLDTDSPIHILINNAGMMADVQKSTVDGNNETAQANHLSHFLLTRLLLDRIVESAPSRIINVASMAHKMTMGKFDPYDINFSKRSGYFQQVQSYARSKLMNVLFTRELARRLYGKGVTVNSLCPGPVQTEFFRDSTWLARAIRVKTMVWAKNELDGAQTTLYLATSDKVQHVSGHYFSECKLDWISLTAADDQLAADLWKESERLTGLDKAY